MNWNSPGEFLEMGGYALYVWGSVLACAIAVGAELVAVRQRRRRVIGLLRRQHRAERLDRADRGDPGDRGDRGDRMPSPGSAS